MAMLDDAATDLRQTVAALRQELDERTAARDEALAQQAATSEILGVISRSPTDVQPVFEAIIGRAAALCDAGFSAVARLEDGLLHLVAVHSMSPEETAAFHSLFPRPPARNFTMGRAFVDGLPVHFGDVLSELDYDTRTLELLQSVAKYSSFLGVPILREGRPIGVIGCGRREVKPFTAAQIELVKTFADQAAIAIDNVRLFDELEARNRDLGEALEQQTATAEVLQVINASPGELDPVFDAMLDRALRLCEAAFGVLFTYDGEHLHAVAGRGLPPEYQDVVRNPVLPTSGSASLRVVRGEAFVQIADLIEDDGSRQESPTRRALVTGGARTQLTVPLRKDGAVLGMFLIYRQEVRPFSDKQITLLQNFAAQAVIAMENARLITETREALEQQTATAEVLQVINFSPGDLAPVFHAIVEKAHTLCGAVCGSLQLWDGEKFRGVAMRGFSEAMGEMLRLGYSPSDMPCQRIVEGERVVHCADLAEIDSPVAREGGVKLGFVRTILYVALRKDDVLLGQIVAGRQEVRPFSEKEIALVENFAAQAVIAMENARLLTETREALEQQTATAEVLGVINSSPGDLAPVFDAMLEKALRLCEASHAHLFTFDGEYTRPVAVRGVPGFGEWLQQLGLHRSPPGSSVDRLRRGERFVHVLDTRETEAYRASPVYRELIDTSGCRSAVSVALRKDDTLLGTIHVYRQEVRPFSDREIAVLENFAAQAVIAMENARLITETREALEQQTATAEVLGVINSSPGDLAPVFEAILDKAHTLCGATLGSLFLFDGELFRAAATHGYPKDLARRLRQGVVLSATTQLLADDVRWVHNPDLTLIDNPTARAVSGRGGVRTNLVLPLRKAGKLLGAISCNRQEVRPFTEKEIALLENFAAQAVIAMENARLLTETREALEQQTATAEVLQVINSSPGHLAPVFDATLDKALRLCEAAFGALSTYEGNDLHQVVAMRGVPAAIAELLRQPVHLGPETGMGRLVRGERLVHIADAADDDGYRLGNPVRRALVDVGGTRTYLAVPLRKDDLMLGAFTIYRQEVRPFTDKQIALLENFAAQAVIAMENARLLTETREALEQQTATAEVLQVINSSPGDLTPVFDAVMENSMRLCEATQGHLYIYDDGQIRSEALRGEPQFAEWQRRRGSHPVTPGSPTERALHGEQVIHIADATKVETYRSSPTFKELIDRSRIRTGVTVALRKDEAFLGTINVYRQEVRPFSEKQIALLQNFAAQAVIAMENARLSTETREALEQQTATAEVLQVINASPGDLAPVFDSLLEKALRLCEAAFGLLIIWDGEQFHRVAFRGVPDELIAAMRQPLKPVPGGFADRLVRGEKIIAVPDLLDAGDQHVGPGAQQLVRFGARSYIGIALRKDEALLGGIVIYRREVRPFSEKQITLLRNFAAQAVIAMENARLITETREALEQQTATAEVLQVINASPGNLAPVFDNILNKAHNLCGASRGALFLFDGAMFHAAAAHGYPEDFAERLRRGLSGPIFAPLIDGARLIHYPDLTQIDDPLARSVAERGGVRTNLLLPLRKDGALLGMISCNRSEVRPFSDKEIALLENFAVQAVIAMENARLITETREALEQQTATAEVLQVINASPGDLAPVFDAMLDKALRLCNAAFGCLFTYDGDDYHTVGARGLPPEFAEIMRQPLPPGPGTAALRVARGEPFVHIADLTEDAGSRPANPMRWAMVEMGGARTQLTVPLRKESALLGMVVIWRQEVQPFSAKEVALLQNFAAQAVIAIENARLLGELQARTDALTRSVAELQALEEVLRAVNSSLDLDTVLATIISRAAQLSQADEGTIYEFDETEEVFVPKSAFGMTAERVEALRERKVRLGETHLGRAAVQRAPVHVEDVQQDPTLGDPDRGELLKGIHAVLAVPLLRDDKVVGGLVIRRRTVGGFAPTIPTLLQTFAGQAVLAIENARLFQELGKRGEEARRAHTAAEAALADLRRAQDRLVQSEKMASLGQLTAGIAHEIKNPLNFVNNFAGLSVELLEELKETARPAIAGLADDERADVDEIVAMLTGNLQKIAEHGRRADGIVKSMLEHSRGGSGERREVDLNGLVEEALNLAYHGARAQDQKFNITLDRDFDRAITPIELAPQEMTRVFLNLFGNGFYAATKRRRGAAEPDFRPVLKVATHDLGEAVEIRIRDNGTGIPPEIKGKLFQPFFTTKPTGEGTGLGLSISWDIVTQQHGGTIEVDSRAGEFTEFTIRLPRTRQVTTTEATA